MSSLKSVLEHVYVPYKDKEKLFIVLGLLLSGKISAGKAAELLGLRIDELWELLDDLNIDYFPIDEREIEFELKGYGEVFGRS